MRLDPRLVSTATDPVPTRPPCAGKLKILAATRGAHRQHNLRSCPDVKRLNLLLNSCPGAARALLRHTRHLPARNLSCVLGATDASPPPNKMGGGARPKPNARDPTLQAMTPKPETRSPKS